MLVRYWAPLKTHVCIVDKNFLAIFFDLFWFWMQMPLLKQGSGYKMWTQCLTVDTVLPPGSTYPTESRNTILPRWVLAYRPENPAHAAHPMPTHTHSERTGLKTLGYWGKNLCGPQCSPCFVDLPATVLRLVYHSPRYLSGKPRSFGA